MRIKYHTVLWAQANYIYIAFTLTNTIQSPPFNMFAKLLAPLSLYLSGKWVFFESRHILLKIHTTGINRRDGKENTGVSAASKAMVELTAHLLKCSTGPTRIKQANVSSWLFCRVPIL